MKCLLTFALLTAVTSTTYSQERDSIFVIFFVDHFEKDSVHLLLNDKVIMSAMLNNEPSADKFPAMTGFVTSKSLQRLTLIDIASNNKFKTILKKGAKYLYIYKRGTGNYQFEYSNRLSLPE
jgi:hypothetical protein